jgi:hypothetical protein
MIREEPSILPYPISYERADEVDEKTFDIQEDSDSTHTILYDNLIPLIRPHATDAMRQIVSFIISYIDKHSDSLIITGPYKRIIFVEARDGDPLFTFLKLNKSDITKIIKKSPFIKSSFKTLNNPFFFLLTSLAILYGEDTKSKQSQDAKYFTMLYMAIRFYSSRQGHIFPYEANKEIMDYTINNISNKFIFKIKGNVLNVLKHIALTNDEKVGTLLRKQHLDKYFKYYITNISSRINGVLDNIRDVYMKNNEAKNYLTNADERYNDEKKTLVELDNVSTTIHSYTDSVYSKLKTNPIDETILEGVCHYTNLNMTTVRYSLESILKYETESVRNLITCTLQSYIIVNKNKAETVKSRYFVIRCLKTYRISNTNDTIDLKIKEILDMWMKKYAEFYYRSNRIATRVNFRKALFFYIVSAITQYVG